MLFEDTDADITTGESIADEDESFEEKPFRVRGCFLSAVERLDEEFTKVCSLSNFVSSFYQGYYGIIQHSTLLSTSVLRNTRKSKCTQ